MVTISPPSQPSPIEGEGAKCQHQNWPARAINQWASLIKMKYWRVSKVSEEAVAIRR